MCISCLHCSRCQYVSYTQGYFCTLHIFWYILNMLLGTDVALQWNDYGSVIDHTVTPTCWLLVRVFVWRCLSDVYHQTWAHLRRLVLHVQSHRPYVVQPLLSFHISLPQSQQQFWLEFSRARQQKTCLVMLLCLSTRLLLQPWLPSVWVNGWDWQKQLL